jgi:hypothetical protein
MSRGGRGFLLSPLVEFKSCFRTGGAKAGSSDLNDSRNEEDRPTYCAIARITGDHLSYRLALHRVECGPRLGRSVRDRRHHFLRAVFCFIGSASKPERRLPNVAPGRESRPRASYRLACHRSGATCCRRPCKNPHNGRSNFPHF